MVDAEDTPRVSLIFCGGGCNIIVGIKSVCLWRLAWSRTSGACEILPQHRAARSQISSARVTYACPLRPSPDAGPAPHTRKTSVQTRPVHRAELASFDCGPTAQPMLPRAKC
eukprot:scaffold137205_cov133-Phaeocystis_antarctica.AAC.1